MDALFCWRTEDDFNFAATKKYLPHLHIKAYHYLLKELRALLVSNDTSFTNAPTLI